jgi:hypothetical protein
MNINIKIHHKMWKVYMSWLKEEIKNCDVNYLGNQNLLIFLKLKKV